MPAALVGEKDREAQSFFYHASALGDKADDSAPESRPRLATVPSRLGVDNQVRALLAAAEAKVRLDGDVGKPFVGDPPAAHIVGADEMPSSKSPICPPRTEKVRWLSFHSNGRRRGGTQADEV